MKRITRILHLPFLNSVCLMKKRFSLILLQLTYKWKQVDLSLLIKTKNLKIRLFLITLGLVLQQSQYKMYIHTKQTKK